MAIWQRGGSAGILLLPLVCLTNGQLHHHHHRHQYHRDHHHCPFTFLIMVYHHNLNHQHDHQHLRHHCRHSHQRNSIRISTFDDNILVDLLYHEAAKTYRQILSLDRPDCSVLIFGLDERKIDSFLQTKPVLSRFTFA